MATACENEDLPEKENAPEFDEDTLRATADVYRNEGNKAFKKGDFISAIHFYSKGIKMNCNEKELKAKLYNNRAIAHFKLGNHQNSLRDAEAAVELNPTFLKAIVRGATACVELKRFKEGITWCDKGLATNETCEALKERYLMSNIPKRNLASGYHILKKLINLHGGQLDVTTNIYLKSCAYHQDSERCTFFHGNLNDPKSSEDTLLYLYVICNMLKSADLHETILTPVICHKHVRYHDGVTLYFSVKFP